MDDDKRQGWLDAIALVRAFRDRDMEGYHQLGRAALADQDHAASVLGALVGMAVRNVTDAELEIRRMIVLDDESGRFDGT